MGGCARNTIAISTFDIFILLNIISIDCVNDTRINYYMTDVITNYRRLFSHLTGSTLSQIITMKLYDAAFATITSDKSIKVNPVNVVGGLDVK